jgi:hypothetical protein
MPINEHKPEPPAMHRAASAAYVHPYANPIHSVFDGFTCIVNRQRTTQVKKERDNERQGSDDFTVRDD